MVKVNLLHTQNSWYLEDGKTSYEREKVKSFFTEWSKRSLDPSQYKETIMESNFQLFSKQMTSPLKFRMFLLSKLPSAYFSGVRVKVLMKINVKCLFLLNGFPKILFAAPILHV